MNKNQNFSIVSSFAGLWLTTMLPSIYEVVFGFLLIFSFGILHGSNDILLLSKLSIDKSSSFSFKILLQYIMVVLLAIILLYVVPSAILMTFIFFSAFHFGEQQYTNTKLIINKAFLYLYYTLYGLTVLFLLFVLNPSDVIEIVYSITNVSIAPSVITYSFFIVVLGYILATVLILLKQKQKWKVFVMEFIYLLCLSIIFKVSTLIWGFTIYFIFWHSIPSLVEQINFLHGDFNFKHFVLYLKNAFWYWLISLIGIAILYFVFGENTLFYSILFSFIAAVTFPHTLVITNMFKTKKAQSN